MRLHKFLVAVLAVTLFTACNKESDSNEKIDETQEKASVKISLKIDEGTRSVSFPNQLLESEKLVYNAIAIAFNKDSRLEDYAIFDTFLAGGVGINDVVLEFEQISTGTHTFYVIVNANATLLERINELSEIGMNVSVFKEKVVELNSVSDIIREKTTQGASSEVSRGFLMSSDRGRSIVVSADSANEVEVTLIRTVAKVSVAYDPDPVTGEVYGGLTDVKYKVVHNPKQTYIFQVEDYLTPFYNITTYNRGNYIGAAHDYQDAITASTVAGTQTYTYCIENNNMKALEGNTTMALIKGAFVPKELRDADGNVIPQGGASTFYRLRDANGVWDIEYYAERPNNVPVGKEVVEYIDGICYYGAWLHPENETGFMVKRNTYVKLSITAVNAAGEPDEGSVVDPEKPLNETSDAYIKVTIKDWEDDEQSTTI